MDRYHLELTEGEMTALRKLLRIALDDRQRPAAIAVWNGRQQGMLTQLRTKAQSATKERT